MTGCWDYLVNPAPPKKDENHPDWHEVPCLKHEDTDLLLQGTDQAQIITKTLLINNALPEKIEALIKDTDDEVDKAVQR